ALDILGGVKDRAVVDLAGLPPEHGFLLGQGTFEQLCIDGEVWNRSGHWLEIVPDPLIAILLPGVLRLHREISNSPRGKNAGKFSHPHQLKIIDMREDGEGGYDIEIVAFQ